MKKRAAPETRLQIDIKQYLTVALGPEIYWTASLTGTYLSMAARTRAKAMGVQRGLPDLLFVFPDGITRFIELKAGASLSPEQRDFRDRCAAHDIWALARSIDDVATALTRWGAKLRAHPFVSPVIGVAA